MVGRGVDLETAVAVKDLALRMGNAAVYKEGGIAGEDYPNHLKLTDVDEVRAQQPYNSLNIFDAHHADWPSLPGYSSTLVRGKRFVTPHLCVMDSLNVCIRITSFLLC